MVSLNHSAGSLDIYKKHLDLLHEAVPKDAAPKPTVDELTHEPVPAPVEPTPEPIQKIGAKEVGVTAKNANEATGILQIAELRINKVQKALEKFDWLVSAYQDPNLDGDRKSELIHDADTLVAEINGLIDTALFMKKPVFGQELNLEVGGREMSASLILDPMEREMVTDASRVEAFRRTLSEKKGEIKEMLSGINRALEEGVDNGQEQGFDFNSFDAGMFKKMMGK